MPEQREFIGARSLYYAIVSADSSGGYTAGTPVFLAKLASIAGEPESNLNIRYFGNMPYTANVTEGVTKLTFVIPGLDPQVAATLLGKYYNTSTKRMVDTGRPKPPWVAVGFASDLDNDGVHWEWFLKGKFTPFKTEAGTKTADVDAKPTSLEYTAIPTDYQYPVNGESLGVKAMITDSNLDASMTDATWFGAVQHPNLPTITVSSQPANATKTVGAITGAVSVTASASSGTLSYQWYQATSGTSYAGATPISGATTNSYTIPTGLAAGSYYYFCAIYIAASSVSLSTNIATITVNAA